MTVRVDPEQNEIGALLDFVNLDGRRVLKIGSGNGRLTWRYADRAARVTAVERITPSVAHAEDNLPPELVRRVVLRRAAFGEFAAETASSTFDVAIFSWSLCCMEQGDMIWHSGKRIACSGAAAPSSTSTPFLVRPRSRFTAPDRSSSRSPHRLRTARASATRTKHSPPWSRAGCSSRSVALSSTSVCTPRRCASCMSSSRRPTRTRGRKGPRRAMRPSPRCTGKSNE